jgi:hypothetical protein
MYNPLLENLTLLKDTELDAKLTDLNKKYMIALKSGNGALVSQIVSVVDSLRFEMTRRRLEANKILAEKENKDLDGLINVG